MALKIRKLPWAFDETTPVWNRANPGFGIVANGITFVAPAFERYIVTATRMAMSEISDPEVFRKYEADLREAVRSLYSSPLILLVILAVATLLILKG